MEPELTHHGYRAVCLGAALILKVNRSGLTPKRGARNAPRAVVQIECLESQLLVVESQRL